MRTIKELLVIARDCIPEEDNFTGLCGTFAYLAARDVILFEEDTMMHGFINSKAPSSDLSYWIGERGDRQARINWTNQQLKNL